MKVSELRKILNDLSSSYDDMEVFIQQSPMHSSIVDSAKLNVIKENVYDEKDYCVSKRDKQIFLISD